MYSWVYLIFLPAFSAVMMLNCLKSKPVCLTLCLALIFLLTVGSRFERLELLAVRNSPAAFHCYAHTAPGDCTFFTPELPWSCEIGSILRLWPCLCRALNHTPTWARQVEGLSEASRLLFMLRSSHSLCLNTFFWWLCSLRVLQDVTCAVILHCWVLFCCRSLSSWRPGSYQVQLLLKNVLKDLLRENIWHEHLRIAKCTLT